MSKTAEEYSKEPVSHDLEEAAARYERENREIILSSVNIVDAFIAGAEWQKRQDNNFERYKDYTDKALISLEEAREQGRQEMKMQMMKEAVEGEIGYWNQRGLSIRLDQSLERLGYGEDTEVKIIIVKKKEEET